MAGDRGVKLETEKRVAETSSVGNQEKWYDESLNRWYKLDRSGYEALSEAVCSKLLKLSNADELGIRFVDYRIEFFDVHGRKRVGSSSENFLKGGESVVTLARLFNKSLEFPYRKRLDSLTSDNKRLDFIVSAVVDLTGLDDFGEYLTFLFEFDALVLNDDRHLNNIALIETDEGFDYCPVFDNGAALLSDMMIYRPDISPASHIRLIRAAPFNMNFARQVNSMRSAFGAQLRFPKLLRADMIDLLADKLPYYPERDRSVISDRVCECVLGQQKKLFL